MIINNAFWFHVLNWFGVSPILITGAFECEYASGTAGMYCLFLNQLPNRYETP
jgi:hypothetical protein